MTIALRQRPLARVVAGIVRANDGAIFDASDMSTMFQDAAGTTPVTAVEQPVGKMLDKSRGLMLGPELVSNGTFDSGIGGWSATKGTVEFVSGALRLTNTTAIQNDCRWYTQLGFTTVVGRSYMATCDITVNASASGVSFGAGTGAGFSTIASTATISGVGKLSLIFKATTTTTYVWTASNMPVGAYFDTDNVSVRELYGNHATQSVTASRPVLSARKNILLATETLATQSVTTLAATYTLSFTGTGSVTLSGTATGTLTGTGTDRVSLTFTPTAGTLTLTVSGSVTKAQIELGSVAGPYQRVNTATDYDTDERYFKKYLRFDGVDDYLNLPYMGLYANGSASVIFCLDDRTQAGNARAFSESSATTSSQYSLRNITSGGFDSYIADDAGASFVDSLNTKGVESKNYIISVIDSGLNVTRYRNSTYENTQAYSRAGKAFTANKTTIGALDTMNTVVAYTAMNLYGLIITKSALTDSQRVACERYLGRKSGVQL